MAYNMNQFKLNDTAGITANPNPNTISAQVDTAQGTTNYLVAGDAVSFGTTAGKMTTVVKAATNAGIGVLLYNPKRDKYYANYMCEVGLAGTIVKMTCNSASVVRGSYVTFISTTGANKVTLGNTSGTASTGCIGIAVDNCSAVGDIIGVLIQPAGV